MDIRTSRLGGVSRIGSSALAAALLCAAGAAFSQSALDAPLGSSPQEFIAQGGGSSRRDRRHQQALARRAAKRR